MSEYLSLYHNLNTSLRPACPPRISVSHYRKKAQIGIPLGNRILSVLDSNKCSDRLIVQRNSLSVNEHVVYGLLSEPICQVIKI